MEAVVLGQHPLGVEDLAQAARARLLVLLPALDGPGVEDHGRTVGHARLAVRGFNGSRREENGEHSQVPGLEAPRPPSEAVAMGTKLLSVAASAEDVLVRCVAGQHAVTQSYSHYCAWHLSSGRLQLPQVKQAL